MKIARITAEIEKLAPLKGAQDWDNVGLLLGNPQAQIKHVLVTIDTTKAVVAEAKELKADMILSYHPLIWDGLKNITTDGDNAHIHQLICAGISVYSIHTAFDVAIGGVNDLLADMLGLVDPEPIGDYVESPAGAYYKFATFVPAVPARVANKVATAIFNAGAGAIEHYSDCSFQSPGAGTFRPMKGSNPTIGKQGRLERVNEIKLESIVPADKIPAVIDAMRKSHPYETPAFDVFRHYDMENKWGLGRIGRLASPTSLDKLVQTIKKTTGARAIGLVGPKRRTVKTAAVCAGSCGKIINTVIDAGADLYVTGELKHHLALAAQEANLTCICLSHTVSERFALKNLVKRLKKQLKDVKITLSRKDADPFEWKNI